MLISVWPKLTSAHSRIPVTDVYSQPYFGHTDVSLAPHPHARSPLWWTPLTMDVFGLFKTILVQFSSFSSWPLLELKKSPPQKIFLRPQRFLDQYFFEQFFLSNLFWKINSWPNTSFFTNFFPPFSLTKITFDQ